MNRPRQLWPFAVLFVYFATPAPAQQRSSQVRDIEKLGTVQFKTSCAAAAQPVFNRAVALLHSFWYEKAASTFSAAASLDPNCAMAYWAWP